jgi:hypothetical protein
MGILTRQASEALPEGGIMEMGSMTLLAVRAQREVENAV